MSKPFLFSRLSRSRISRTFIATVSLTLASCSTVFSYLPIYTLEIQQGNIVDQNMVDQLRPGMNKRQVLYIMGSPMLVDAFHKNRWDYIYSDKPKEDEDKVQKEISLFFENDQIVGVRGDMKPSAVPVIKPSLETTVDVPKRDLDETIWDDIVDLFDYGNDASTTDPENLKPETDAADPQ